MIALVFCSMLFVQDAYAQQSTPSDYLEIDKPFNGISFLSTDDAISVLNDEVDRLATLEEQAGNNPNPAVEITVSARSAFYKSIRKNLRSGYEVPAAISASYSLASGHLSNYALQVVNEEDLLDDAISLLSL